jgi:uncharacterized protein HemY
MAYYAATQVLAQLRQFVDTVEPGSKEDEEWLKGILGDLYFQHQQWQEAQQQYHAAAQVRISPPAPLPTSTTTFALDRKRAAVPVSQSQINQNLDPFKLSQ